MPAQPDDPHIAFMISVVEDPPVPPQENSFQRHVKTLLEIRRTTPGPDPINTHPLMEPGPTMEYVLEYHVEAVSGVPEEYTSIINTFPLTELNYLFQQLVREAHRDYDHKVSQIAMITRNRHEALKQHAMRMYADFQQTLATMTQRSPKFKFEYNATTTLKPDDTLPKDDVKYLHQFARYFFHMTLQLREAFRIHKRITHYEQQTRRAKREHFELGGELGGKDTNLYLSFCLHSRWDRVRNKKQNARENFGKHPKMFHLGPSLSHPPLPPVRSAFQI